MPTYKPLSMSICTLTDLSVDWWGITELVIYCFDSNNAYEVALHSSALETLECTVLLMF